MGPGYRKNIFSFCDVTFCMEGEYIITNGLPSAGLLKQVTWIMNLKTTAILSLLFSASSVLLANEESVPSNENGDGMLSADSLDDSTLAADSIADADFTDLDELVVVEKKKLVESDGAKLSYNVTEDPEAASSNTLDILRKVPGVTVDAEDNVRVNGQSSFKILMNGREDPMLKGDLKTVLKSIPASSIKKIEVISEPGAKYEAEGVGGILNIVTDRKRSLTGYTANLNAWINAYQVGGNVNVRAKFNKVMLDANVSYNNGRVWPRESESERTYEYLDGSDQMLKARQKAKNGWDYTGANINMSWEPDTLNLFTLSGYYGHNTWGNKGSEHREMFSSSGSTLWSLQRDFVLDGAYNGFGGQASYQHNFKRDDHNLIISYEMDYGPQWSNTDYFLEYLSGTGLESPYSSQRSKANYYNHILQLDYRNQFNAKHLLEAGAKMYINRVGNLSRTFQGPSESEAQELTDMTVDVDQTKDIYSLYGSYNGTFSKWNVKAGLRYELTQMGMKYHIGDYPDFTTYLNDIVPNAAISYNISSATNLRLAYQMRISRPGIGQVNPYRNTLTPDMVYYGNPDLESERGHTLSFGYSNYEGKFTGSAKLTYRYVNNSINDIIFMRDGILNSTYANVGISHNGSLDLSADWNVTSDFRWSVYASGTYSYLKADSEHLKAKNHGWQTYISTNLNYTMPSKVRLSGYAGFYTPWIDLQSRGTENGYYYGLGASRSFLKNDALTLNLGVSNFLPTHRRNSYTQGDESVRLNYKSRYSQWNVSFSVGFNFGGLTATVKKTAANIEKESGSNGGSKGGN